jgi:LPXTG-site transpeptidase (sortase) family protein
MKRHSSFSTILILVVTLGALGVFASTFRHASMAPYVEPEITVAGNEAAQRYHPDDPERLIIPSIGVDAAVQKVGIGQSGHMAVPTNYTDVGWYKYGAKPGGKGNAVFDGHLDNGFGKAGVFKNLHMLNQGDALYIKTAEGDNIRYTIERIDRVEAHTTSTDMLFTTEGSPRVTLITCEGDWNPEAKTYSERLIVTAYLAP